MTITATFRKGFKTATITLDPAASTVEITEKTLTGPSTTRITAANDDQAAKVANVYFNRYEERGWKVQH